MAAWFYFVVIPAFGGFCIAISVLLLGIAIIGFFITLEDEDAFHYKFWRNLLGSLVLFSFLGAITPNESQMLKIFAVTEVMSLSKGDLAKTPDKLIKKLNAYLDKTESNDDK